MRWTPKKSLIEYLEQYDQEHTARATRAVHMVAVPITVVAVPLLTLVPLVALTMMILGFTLQSTSHALFEPKHATRPFDPWYTLIAPVWVAMTFESLVLDRD